MATFDVIAKDIRRYPNFESMIAKEDYRRIVPEARSAQEVLALLKRIYPPDRERLGVVVLEFSRPSK